MNLEGPDLITLPRAGDETEKGRSLGLAHGYREGHIFAGTWTWANDSDWLTNGTETAQDYGPPA